MSDAYIMNRTGRVLLKSGTFVGPSTGRFSVSCPNGVSNGNTLWPYTVSSEPSEP